ncbi:MAG: methyltransferase domain-containing protein [Pseudonocardiaceae bacterium]
MTMIQFDAETSRRVEAIYTTPDVVEQRRVVHLALALRPGEQVLDVGSGPGLLAAEMAAEVGPGGQVCGIDISDSMLAIAQARAHAPGSAPIEFRRGSANDIPYADGSFVASSGGVTAQEAQAWANDLRGLGPAYFFSLNRYLFCATSRP